MVIFSVNAFNHEPSPNEPAPHPLATAAIPPRIQLGNNGYHQQRPLPLLQRIAANQQVSFVLILILFPFFFFFFSLQLQHRRDRHQYISGVSTLHAR